MSFKVQHFKPEDNETKLKANLDLLEEKQSRIAEMMVVYQSKIARHINRKVRVQKFKEGDLVLKESDSKQIGRAHV